MLYLIFFKKYNLPLMPIQKNSSISKSDAVKSFFRDDMLTPILMTVWDDVQIQ